MLRARLVAPMPDDRPWGWLGPLLVTAFGAFLRFNRLRVPKALIFDETYYAKDAWSILKHGVEWKLLDSKVANPMIVARASSAASRGEASSARPIGTAASVSRPAWSSSRPVMGSILSYPGRA